MEVNVLNIQGKATGSKVTLSDEVFAIDPSDHAIYLDVRQYMAHQRQGTHKVKGRGEVAGSTKKPYKQKGTGNARQGHKRSPLHRHGGTMQGPVPHEYDFKLNKKVKRLARRSALSYKARENQILVVDAMSFNEPKTKTFADILGKLNVAENKVLVVTNQLDVNLLRSGRNIPGVSILHVGELNTYDIVNAERLVVLQDAVDSINNTLA